MAVHAEIYDTLVQAARRQELVYYGDIAPLAGLDMDRQADRTAIGQILGDISKCEHIQGRPMLSAIVVQRGSNTPGHGFFTLARNLGLLVGNAPMVEEAFHVSEVNKVHAYWSKAPA